MKTTIVRYEVRPDAARENEDLIRKVFAQLALDAPRGMRYETYRLDDGVSFLHVATFDETQTNTNPLLAVEAFRDFQIGISMRCEGPPRAKSAALIGKYDAMA